jgi:hypothetical protein
MPQKAVTNISYVRQGFVELGERILDYDSFRNLVTACLSYTHSRPSQILDKPALPTQTGQLGREEKRDNLECLLKLDQPTSTV